MIDKFIKFVNDKVCYLPHPMDVMKTAIVSGGSRGFGKALVSRMAEDGWKLLTFSRGMEESLPKVNGPIFTMKADLRLDRDVKLVINRATDLFGRTDLLILNAGTITKCSGLLHSSITELRRVFEVNVFANYFLLKTFLAANPEGSVVHVTSDAARQHYPGWGIYGASKAAMDFLIDTLGIENKRARLYSIDPGDMDTEMHRTAAPDSDSKSLQTPEEAASVFYRKLIDLLEDD